MEMTILMHEIRTRIPHPAFAAAAAARSPLRLGGNALSPQRGAPIFQRDNLLEVPRTDQALADGELHFGALSVAYAMMSRGELADLIDDIDLGLAPPWLRPCDEDARSPAGLLDVPPCDAPERLMAAAIHRWRSRTSGS